MCDLLIDLRSPLSLSHRSQLCKRYLNHVWVLRCAHFVCVSFELVSLLCSCSPPPYCAAFLIWHFYKRRVVLHSSARCNSIFYDEILYPLYQGYDLCGHLNPIWNLEGVTDLRNIKNRSACGRRLERRVNIRLVLLQLKLEVDSVWLLRPFIMLDCACAVDCP